MPSVTDPDVSSFRPQTPVDVQKIVWVRAFGSPAMILQVRNHWSVAGSFQPSHRLGISSFLTEARGKALLTLAGEVSDMKFLLAFAGMPLPPSQGRPLALQDSVGEQEIRGKNSHFTGKAL